MVTFQRGIMHFFISSAKKKGFKISVTKEALWLEDDW
jgi:hypothetical protein